MEKPGTITVTSAVTVAAALVGAWVALDPWPVVGWTTPNQHAADFDVAVGEVRDFRDEWRCDEYREELIELLKQQQSGDDTVETAERIHVLRQRMGDTGLDCERFED